jgi:hypothetical protein
MNGPESIRANAHEVLAASKWRASGTILTLLSFPFLVAWSLSTSGHGMADYLKLLATGELSIVRQAIGSAGAIVVITLFVPSAITAIASQKFVSTTDKLIIDPAGHAFAIADIESISIRKGFWRRSLLLRGPGIDGSIDVTWARGLSPDLKRALRADPHLQGVSIE